jgi:hypothetical protein
MVTDNSSLMLTGESWYIPFDIVMIISLILAIISSLIFLLIIAHDKTNRTVQTMLICDSCLAGLFLGCVLLGGSVFSLQNDTKQIQYQDLLCVFRAYLVYVAYFSQYYSYLLQAIYRYIIIVYSTRISWQSTRFQASLIALKWVFSFVYPFPFLFTGHIIYLPNSQICQVPVGFSLPIMYNSTVVYLIPVTCIILIYVKFVLYVRHMSKRVTPANTLFRAQRELRMVRRIVMLVTFLVMSGLPYMIFIFISFITSPPKYYLRIAYLSIDVSLAFVTTVMFETTPSVKNTMLSTIGVVSNVIVPTTTR